MSDEKHSKGILVDQFCAKRTGSRSKCKCPSPNNYIKNCDIPDDIFLQGQKRKVKKKFEAHHLVCIASATQFLGKDPLLVELIKLTRWCINAKPNMLAMPVWGHTIKHYCNLKTATSRTDVDAPWFENIPMHDYDHNSTGGYKSDVDAKMVQLANDLLELAKPPIHETASETVAKQLEDSSKHFKKFLLGRSGGKRVGGTHKAWKKGSKKPESDWYRPFSMARTAVVEKRVFPATGASDSGKVAAKIQALADSIKRWGGT